MGIIRVIKAIFHCHEWHEFRGSDGWRRRRRCTKCGAVQIFAIVPVLRQAQDKTSSNPNTVAGRGPKNECGSMLELGSAREF